MLLEITKHCDADIANEGIEPGASQWQDGASSF